MFDNPGRKLKFIAVITFIVECISSFIGGIFYWVEEEEFFGGILIMLVGFAVAWLSVIVLYAFGQLVENSDNLVYIASKSTGIKVETTQFSFTTNSGVNNNYAPYNQNAYAAPQPQAPTFITCPKCGELNGANNTACFKCRTPLSNPQYQQPQPQTHQWRCNTCGNMTDSSPCKFCGK